MEREARWERWGWRATGIQEEECRHLGGEGNGDTSRNLGEFPGSQSLWGWREIRFLAHQGSCRGKCWGNYGSRIGKEQGPGTVEVRCVHEWDEGVIGSCFWTSSTVAFSPWNKALKKGEGGRGKIPMEGSRTEGEESWGREGSVHGLSLCSFGGDTLQTHVFSTLDELNAVLPPFKET